MNVPPQQNRVSALAHDLLAMIMSVRWLYLVIAFSMAVTLWYLVTVRDKIETWVDVRVEFKSAPSDLIIRNGLINKISVRVRGAKGLSRGIADRNFSVSIDLSSITKGTNSIAISPSMLPFSSAFEVMDISPPRFQVLADAIESRNVPLESVFEGSLSGDFFVKSLRMNPPMATLRGPESIIRQMNSIKIPLVLGNGTRAGLIDQHVDIPVPDEVKVEPAKVLLDLEVGVRTKNIRLTRQIMMDVPNGHSVKINPARVTLEVAVPESQAGKQDVLATIVPMLTLPAGAKGTIQLPVKVLLPENSSLKSVTPKEVTVTVQN